MYKNVLWLIGLGLVTIFLVSCGLARLVSEDQGTEPAVAAVPVAEAPTFTPTLTQNPMFSIAGV
jgi:hypothetical protein